MTQGLEAHPLPYFLAVVMAVVGLLWGCLSTVVWWAARSQRNLYRELLTKEERASLELRRERDEARADHRHDLVKLMLAAEGLIRIRDELDAKRKRA